ncbi:MAG TPA: 30S ribosomal protein S6 [Deltaproteobacteria bacterium]|nr:30S ribosomal protein S6 [Deltaproteobacteria bacterium]
MTKYETAILFHPELPEDRRKEFLAKIEGIVASFGGEILKQDDWGIRKLAYSIRKTSNAFYTFLIYSGRRGVVEEVERNIKIFDDVMRHMTSRVEFEIKPAAAEPAPEEGSPAAGSGGETPGTPLPPDEAPPA